MMEIKMEVLTPKSPRWDEFVNGMCWMMTRGCREGEWRCDGDLSFEFDAMGTVPGHGFHPLKARQSWSIPNPQDVHR